MALNNAHFKQKRQGAARLTDVEKELIDMSQQLWQSIPQVEWEYDRGTGAGRFLVIKFPPQTTPANIKRLGLEATDFSHNGQNENRAVYKLPVEKVPAFLVLMGMDKVPGTNETFASQWKIAGELLAKNEGYYRGITPSPFTVKHEHIIGTPDQPSVSSMVSLQIARMLYPGKFTDEIAKLVVNCFNANGGRYPSNSSAISDLLPLLPTVMWNVREKSLGIFFTQPLSPLQEATIHLHQIASTPLANPITRKSAYAYHIPVAHVVDYAKKMGLGDVPGTEVPIVSLWQMDATLHAEMLLTAFSNLAVNTPPMITPHVDSLIPNTVPAATPVVLIDFYTPPVYANALAPSAPPIDDVDELPPAYSEIDPNAIPTQQPALNPEWIENATVPAPQPVNTTSQQAGEEPDLDQDLDEPPSCSIM